jgi:acyl-[acyl-carrier-protein]-phospholipid O-acyltransferase/long-chain-fatty-acid--[acyl-carrier-protein] ligase
MNPASSAPSPAVESPGPDHPLPPLPRGWTSLARVFADQARRLPKKVAIADTGGAALTYADAFLRAVALSRVLKREIGASEYVGVFVPPSAPGAIANLALTLLGKIPVNLNYTAGEAVLDSSIEQAGITHVITSRRAIAKFKLTPKGNLIHLEDVPKKVTTRDKLMAALISRAIPAPLLGAFLPGLKGNLLHKPATIIFTSGSTGDPKGVVLSHRNVLANVHQINNHLILTDEVVLGVLPFFHSFGFTITIWTVLALGMKAVYHFNPLDSRIVGNLCQEHGATLLAATPTFARGYAQRCEPEQFRTMRLLLLGAEKLKPEIAQEIEEKLKITAFQGYGCTELSPVVAVNVPTKLRTPAGQDVDGNRPGTVGMPLPGTAIRTTDPETGAPLPRGSEGIVWVKGPQVMEGYLNRPEETAKAIVDGWYNTGDLGFLDPDGFLSITGRQSRFSKIGGEMVPHVKVESAIGEILGVVDGAVAVTALPDPKRGERLVVVHTPLTMTPEEILARLRSGVLPNLWVPSAGDFVAVDELPLLGTGKLDLRRLREIAAEHAHSRL